MIEEFTGIKIVHELLNILVDVSMEPNVVVVAPFVKRTYVAPLPVKFRMRSYSIKTTR